MCDPKSGFCLGLSLMTLGGIVFCILCSEKIPDYIHTKNFKKTTCTVDHSYFSKNVCCDLATHESMEDCATWYPCYVTVVTYQDDGGSSQEGLMFHDFESFSYQDNATCTYYHCALQDWEDANADSQAFVADRGTAGQSYSCYYNPDEMVTVFLTMTDVNWVVHSVLWPGLVFIVGLIITLISCIGDPETNFGNQHRHKLCWKIDDSEDELVKNQVENFNSKDRLGSDNAGFQADDAPHSTHTQSTRFSDKDNDLPTIKVSKECHA